MSTTERGAEQSIVRGHTSTSEHAVLIPTSVGPIGAIVTEPRGEPRCSLVLLPGAGDVGRSGINASWARAARAIADRGLTVLRLDYLGTRESGVGFVYYMSGGTDDWLALGRRRFREAKLTLRRNLDEVVEWFGARTGNGIALAGSCAGGRDAARLASRHRRIVGVACFVPALGSRTPWRGSWRHPSVLLGRRPPEFDFTGVDREAVREFRRIPRRVPVTLIVGEHDPDDVFILRDRLGARGVRMAIEVVPGIALHPFRSPAAQDESVSRLVAWADRLTAT